MHCKSKKETFVPVRQLYLHANPMQRRQQHESKEKYSMQPTQVLAQEIVAKRRLAGVLLLEAGAGLAIHLPLIAPRISCSILSQTNVT